MTVQHPSVDSRFMLRALELAVRGRGFVSPNPMVGAVVVYDGRIIGEGWHRKYGSAHAEVNAIRQVREPQMLRESTLYVTLEPCNHVGKTPPCTELILEKGIPRVVIANSDPNPAVSGNGAEKLRDAGVEVIEGVMAEEGEKVNRRFFTAMKRRRPYIMLKWAQTADGFMARENYDSKWISDPYSRMLVHKWRSEEDAVLVGTNTAFYDNPRLNVRDWSGRDPVRIVIDRNLRLDSKLNLFDGSQDTICYTLKKTDHNSRTKFVTLGERDFLNAMLDDLLNRGIHSVLVEGGSQTLISFLDQKVWDEAFVFTSSHSFHEGIRAPVPEGNLTRQFSVLNDVLSIFQST